MILTFLLSAPSANAAEKASTVIIPGQYIRSADSGTLKIQQGDNGKLVFEIESVGSNCHTCSVSGTIQAGLGHAESWAADGSDSNCRIIFKEQGTEIHVSSTTVEECHAYCGARASFEGSYKKMHAPCSRSDRQKNKNTFLKLYRSRDFASAAAVLEPMLAECSKFMDRIESDQIRNDLALAQFHGGNPAACLQTLSATHAASYTGEEDLKGNMPPCDFDNYISTAKATWHNKSLCEKRKTQKPRGSTSAPQSNK